MKKSLCVLLLCAYAVDQQYALNVHNDFGKKHFIAGYTQKNDSLTYVPAKKRNKENPSTFSYFTSVHDVRKEIDACLKKAKKSIKIAAFALTDFKIAEQLIKAHDSNVKVTIVTDKEKMREKHSKIAKLVKHGIPVSYYNQTLNTHNKQKNSRDALMHHKFIIIDDQILIFGSLNLTKSAQEMNMENITITTKARMVLDYCDEFERLLSLSTPTTSSLFNAVL